MKVIAEEPWNWFLFEDGKTLYLDVLVEHGATSYSVTNVLNIDQATTFKQKGSAYLNVLASDMRTKALMRQWSVPALPSDWAELSISAVREWNLHK
jgi:hypothetical protein